MPKFEYTTVARDVNLSSLQGALDDLSKLGEEGWEAVCVLETGRLGFEYILLKRIKE